MNWQKEDSSQERILVKENKSFQQSVDYEQLKIKSYQYWDLYLHENQCYLGRTFVQLKNEVGIDDFMAINGAVRDEFFAIGQSVKMALKSLFKPDKMNYAALSNVSSVIHVHIIPRYKDVREFKGLIYKDERWGSNYAPYDRSFVVEQSTLFSVRDALQEVLSAAKPYLVLLIGTSGSGKTTILKAIAKELSTDAVSINYFDDIGVPSFEEMVANYGSPEKWQEVTTHLWIEKLANIADKKLIFLEGSFNPEFAVSHLQKLGMHKYLIICVHAERAVREKRLSQQRNQPELITQDMENFAQVLKAETLVLGGIVLESTDNNLSNVVQEIMGLTAKHVGKW